MPLYQRKQLPDTSLGEPASLPKDLVGLAAESLADLTAALDAGAAKQLGYTGQGFFPVADPEPEPEPRRISRIALLERFTAQERIPIRVAAKTDPILEDFLEMLGAAETVDLDNENTVAGFAYLVAEKLLTQERADELRGDLP